MRPALLLCLAACAAPAARPPDASVVADAAPDAAPSGCSARGEEACATPGARCTNQQGESCACVAQQAWVCNPPGCPDVLNPPATDTCAQPGLVCLTGGEYSLLCVAPEDVWVACTSIACYPGSFPHDGDPCCGSPGLPPQEFPCDTGCVGGARTVCDCTADDHWSCRTDACPDAG